MEIRSVKNKVLILQAKLPHYRIPVFNALVEKGYDVTVAYNGGLHEESTVKFKQLQITSKRLGPFVIQSSSLYRICLDFDVIIAMYNIRWLSLMRLGLKKKRTFKLIYWGIGVSASYKNKYGESSQWDWLRYFWGRKADALVFYDEWPIHKYLTAGFNKRKLFVASNTVDNQFADSGICKKERFLFVGTLYKEKGLSELIEAYSIAFRKCPSLYSLDIVGAGRDLDELNALVHREKLEHKIKFHGAIYDSKRLGVFFRQSLACISPNQAGLSVLTSFSYGVPFVTGVDAITGGERNNVIDKYNGFTYKGGCKELAAILIKLQKDQAFARQLGKNAKFHYDTKRSVYHMIKGFDDAIQYTLKEN